MINEVSQKLLKLNNECIKINNKISEMLYTYFDDYSNYQNFIKVLTGLEHSFNEIKNLQINKKTPFICDIGRLYYLKGKFILHQKGFVKDRWFHEKQFDEMQKKNLFEVEKYFKYSEECYNNLDISILKSTDDLSWLKRERKLLYQDLASLYYMLNNYEKFIEYSLKAIDNNSIQAAQILIKYYCDEDDYNKVFYYFEKSKSILNDFISSYYIYISNKFMIFTNVYLYLYKKGDYEKALSINQECINYIKTVSNFDCNGMSKICNKRRKDCLNKIKDKSTISYNNDILSNYFNDDVLNKMNNDIKVYINTSINIYNLISNSQYTIDYSACLMPIMKAVEKILFDIINDYIIYLKNKDFIDFKYITPKLTYKDNGCIYLKEYLDHIEYGTVLNAIARYNIYHSDNDDRDYLPNKYFVEYCKFNNISDSYNIILKFAENLKVIKDKRNKVAHMNRILKDDAIDTYDYLLTNIKFIEFLYNTYGYCIK